jgi:hypothetical protein
MTPDRKAAIAAVKAHVRLLHVRREAFRRLEALVALYRLAGRPQ